MNLMKKDFSRVKSDRVFSKSYNQANMKRTKLIQSLDRGLQIMDIMKANPGTSFIAKDIAAFLNIDPSSAFRLLNTLEQRDYVKQSQIKGAYTLGPAVYSLYGAMLKQENISEQMRKYLEYLSRVTGEATHLAIKQKDRAVFIDRVSGTEIISVNTDIGQNEPLYCTAVGKALICKLNDLQIKHLFPGELSSFTSNTVTDMEKLLEELAAIRENGIAYDKEEYQNGVLCIAAPIYDCSGKIVCAVGISGPIIRMTENLSALSEKVKEISRNASTSFGYTY